MELVKELAVREIFSLEMVEELAVREIFSVWRCFEKLAVREISSVWRWLSSWLCGKFSVYGDD